MGGERARAIVECSDLGCVCVCVCVCAGMSGFQDMIKAMGGAGEGGLLQSMLGMPGGAAAAAAMGRGRGRGRGK
jgi:hypothetical protein